MAGHHQSSFPVESGAQLCDMSQSVINETVNNRASAVNTMLQEHCADQGLNGIAQNRRLISTTVFHLALAQQNVVANVQLVAANSGQGILGNDFRTQGSKVTFRPVRVLRINGFRHHELEHRVAQELEALIVGQAWVFMGKRAMSESVHEHLGAQACSQGIEKGLRAGGVETVIYLHVVAQQLVALLIASVSHGSPCQ